MDRHQEQALKFLKKTGTTMAIDFLKHDKYFDDDFKRDIYQITMTRGACKYVFTFGQSIVNSMKYKDRGLKTVYLCNYQSEDGRKKVTEEYIEEFCNIIRCSSGTVKRQSPSEYDVLACLQKYPVDTFEDFCSDFGYDEDSRKAYKTYEAVKKEYESLAVLFNDQELEELQEIN